MYENQGCVVEFRIWDTTVLIEKGCVVIIDRGYRHLEEETKSQLTLLCLTSLVRGSIYARRRADETGANGDARK